MKPHLTDGELRAALDGELAPQPLQHLAACAACAARQQQLQAAHAETGRRLAALAPLTEPAPAAGRAWARFSHKLSIQKEQSMTKPWFSLPLPRLAAAAFGLLLFVLAFPGTRALAGELLNLLRVQQVQVVAVDFTGLEQLTGDGALGNQFAELISQSVSLQPEPGDPTAAASAAEASQLAGFTVRVPADLTPSQINVTEAAVLRITLDRAKTQTLLNEAGRADLTLPAATDGADIIVEIPASVSVAFGTCPTPGSDEPGNTEQSAILRRYPDCLILAQIPSPTVNTPAGLDIEALARIGLEFTGMTAAEAAAFTSTVDWTSTLLVPIPQDASTNQQVQVDGVTGTLIQRLSGDTPQFALLWVKDGIIYTISGLGDNAQAAFEIANALP